MFRKNKKNLESDQLKREKDLARKDAEIGQEIESDQFQTENEDQEINPSRNLEFSDDNRLLEKDNINKTDVNETKSFEFDPYNPLNESPLNESKQFDNNTEIGRDFNQAARDKEKRSTGNRVTGNRDSAKRTGQQGNQNRGYDLGTNKKTRRDVEYGQSNPEISEQNTEKTTNEQTNRSLEFGNDNRFNNLNKNDNNRNLEFGNDNQQNPNRRTTNENNSNLEFGKDNLGQNRRNRIDN